MRHTLTVRLPPDLAAWLDEAARRAGLPQSQLVRDQLEATRAKSDRKAFMRLAGSVRGAADLSTRKGFSRP